MISEIHLHVNAGIEDAVSEFLLAQGSMGTVVDISEGKGQPIVKGYFYEHDKDEIAIGISLILAANNMEISAVSIDWFVVEDKNWANAWKEYAKPIPTGQRLLILPSWLEAEPGTSRQIIRMDPEMAFGSGSHETTRGCLEAFEKIASQRDLGHVLDMGTGSGVLAIGAVLLGAKRVTAVDNDPIAVETAIKNCQINRADSNISVILSERPPSGLFATIVANILAEVLIDIRWSLVEVLASGGSLILSGILDEQADDVIAAYKKCGLLIIDALPMGEWVTLVFTKE
ncbi:MAG: 50S ribosomal protein L11 methyltransferase [Magnetococcales bacterium]|nr:50S ribosomal protein L11 methyltransferase [Magnetococcales bacterium]